jgi:hypothetical protein
MTHETTYKLVPTIKIVTWSSNMCMLLAYVTSFRCHLLLQAVEVWIIEMHATSELNA